MVRDSAGIGQGGIRLAQQEVPLRINSGSNTGPGFCFLDGASAPMTDEQVATLYPTVQSYVDKIVAKTLASVAAGYIPKDFTRDPAWYTDIRDAVNDNAARIDSGVAGQLRASALRAEGSAAVGDKYLAMLDTDLIADLASHSIPNAAARDAVLRPAKAASALLWKAIDAPTSTTVSGGVGGTVPATLSISLGAPVALGVFTPGVARDYDATSTVTTTSSGGNATLTIADPSATATGHLVNGVHSLPQALQVAGTGAFAPLGGSASPTPLKTWDAPTASEAVTVKFRQSIAANDPLRTGAYSKTVTFTLSTTAP